MVIISGDSMIDTQAIQPTPIFEGYQIFEAKRMVCMPGELPSSHGMNFSMVHFSSLYIAHGCPAIQIPERKLSFSLHRGRRLIKALA
jgi:hypothetical protein